MHSTKSVSSRTIRFDRQGENWFEGFPVGNGRLGAMVVGGAPTQEIHLNEETFWSPGPRERDFTGAADALPEVRARLAAGDILGAQALAPALLGTPHLGAAFQPIGQLIIAGEPERQGARFVRELDLATGVARFEWSWPDGSSLTREVVASRTPSVILVRQRGSGAIAGPTRIGFASPFGAQVTLTGPRLAATGQWSEVPANRELVADSYRLRDYEAGRRLRFAVGVEVLKGETAEAAGATGGSGPGASGILLTSTDWTIAIAVATDFAGLDPTTCAFAELDRAREATPATILARAVAAHADVFGRASIEIAEPAAITALTTDRRIHAVRAGGIDDALAILLADYGRYLLIASSVGGDLPPTLQGVWNSDTEPAWGSDWTININLQMCLWAADAFGLPESVDTLSALVDNVAVAGRRTAAEIYRADGWVTHHNNDIWFNTAPTTLVEIGLFAAAGLWLLQQLWQSHRHYPERGGGDHLYELTRDAARFLESWLVEDADGYLVTSPSSTPENGYLLGDAPRPRSRAIDPEFWRHGWLGEGPTLDIWLVRDTLDTLVREGERRGEDAAVIAGWNDILSRLRPVPLQDGEIPEWTRPYRALELGHRHLSPLYALYPGTDDYREPSELRDAAIQTLLARQANVTSSSNGWGGWSKIWAAACWARLGDGDRALASLTALTMTGIAPDSLLHAFPDFDGVPAADAVHQSDANMGFAAAVAELVLQSSPGVIRLLPALPTRWRTGTVRTLRAVGGVDVSFRWADGVIDEVTLSSTIDQTVVVTAPGHPDIRISLAAGRAHPVTLAAGTATREGTSK
jgi:alpha-L-fucosidase 2